MQNISSSFPLDDGFLRRECAACRRQFKWGTEDASDRSEDEQTDDASYHCPYCNHEAPAAGSAWMTAAQMQYARDYAANEVLGPALRNLDRSFARLKSSVFKVTRSGGPQAPIPLNEPNDMVRVDFECHPEQPIKILEGWSEPAHCLICGTTRS